eukprot:scaffold9987_cov145-Skeletonema_marinoi.AAC.1
MMVAVTTTCKRRHMTCQPRSMLMMGLFILAMAHLPIISAFTSPSSVTSAQTRHLDRQSPMIQYNNYILSDRRTAKILYASQQQEDDEDDEEEDGDEEMPPIITGFELDEDDNDTTTLTPTELQSMTVPQLKQQLRLRGKKVSGNKSDLIARLLEKKRSGIFMDSGGGDDVGDGYSKYQKPYTPSSSSSSQTTTRSDKKEAQSAEESKRVSEAKARGAEIVDVTEFLEDEKEWKTNFRSSDRKKNILNDDDDDAIDVESKGQDGDDDDASSSSSSSPE